MKDKVTEANICMILDTFMYTDYSFAKEGDTLEKIIDEMPEYVDVSGAYKEEYEILKDASENPKIGNLRISNMARRMGYNDGTNAVTFVNDKDNKVYVVYRGTADGEWLDNGNGMTKSVTNQQKEATRYFDEVVQNLELDGSQAVYISGHSKGGNKVQFVTMDSENSDYITACYSVDGQGQSEKAIKTWKSRYSEEEYEKRTSKIYGINGQNDFISVLGNCIIPLGNISYIKTPCETTNIAGCHDITMMYAKEEIGENGEVTYKYTGDRNDYVFEKGKLGDWANKLSDELMKIPSMLRDGCAASMMQLVEIVNGNRMTGLLNEHATLQDIREFKDIGIPVIIGSILGSHEGLELIKGFIKDDGLINDIKVSGSLDVNYTELRNEAERLENLAKNMDQYLLEIEMAGSVIPLLFDGYSFRKPHIDNSVCKLKYEQLKIRKIAALQEQIAKLYEKFDNMDFGI